MRAGEGELCLRSHVTVRGPLRRSRVRNPGVILGSVPLAAVLLVGAVTGPGGASGAGGSAATAPLPALLARVDDLHRRRDEKTAWQEQQRLIQTLIARGAGDYEVLWRAARFYFWASDDPGVSREQRSRWGKDGWDFAERAIAVNPNDAAGYYWAAICMGNYALGLGVVKALSQGMEAKFRDRLTRAQALNGAYEFGGIETAWGRFFDKLPWPKRDKKKAEEHLRKAIELNPSALRARVYLASSYLDSDRAPEAKRLLDEVAAAVPGRYDAPEERRAQALAQGLMPTLYAKLK
jgi:tetratricopeptide (TPR) repeat protein